MLNKLLHSLLDGKIMNSVMSWTQHPTEVTITSTICDRYSARICSLDEIVITLFLSDLELSSINKGSFLINSSVNVFYNLMMKH